MLCLALCSCSASYDVQSELDGIFAQDEEPLKVRHNNYTDYIDYYLPSDVAEFSNDKTSFIFMYNDSRIVMDINIAAIINSVYYRNVPLSIEGFFDEDRKVYQKSGSLTDMSKQSREYIFDVYRYDDRYLLNLVCEDVLFYAWCVPSQLLPVSSRILIMAKSALVNRNDIAADFSSIEVIDYEKKQVNLFETIMPVNGVINDLLIGESGQTPDE